MTRIYEIKSDWGSDSKLICWGMSRFGDGHDAEMEEAVAADKVPGDGKPFCVGFAPEMPKFRKPEQVRAQRIGNMLRRAAKLPLFADQIEAEEIQKDYFSLAAAENHQTKRKAYMEKWCEKFWREHTAELEIKLSNQANPPDRQGQAPSGR